MPGDMEATDRNPARVQDMPADLVEEYVGNVFSMQDMPDALVEEYARNAFSTPYCLSHTQEEDDDDIDVYAPEHEVQVIIQKLRWRRSHLYMYQSQ